MKQPVKMWYWVDGYTITLSWMSMLHLLTLPAKRKATLIRSMFERVNPNDPFIRASFYPLSRKIVYEKPSEVQDAKIEILIFGSTASDKSIVANVIESALAELIDKPEVSIFESTYPSMKEFLDAQD